MTKLLTLSINQLSMGAAEEAFYQMSEAQQREIRTAVVLTVLGPIVRSNISAIVNAMKGVLSQEVRKLVTKKEKNDADERLLSLLQGVVTVSPSLQGIRELERMYERAQRMPELFPIAVRCFNALPSVLQFAGFGSLIKHRAVSKFIAFAMSWRYSGVGYEPPRGMSEPFSGYDDIINSLVGHPKCMAEFRRQGKLWEDAQQKKR